MQAAFLDKKSNLETIQLKNYNMKFNYDFDKIIGRTGTSCAKWDSTEQIFGEKDLLPMWVADMDFQ